LRSVGDVGREARSFAFDVRPLVVTVLVAVCDVVAHAVDLRRTTRFR
jgi:hypothetical protein